MYERSYGSRYEDRLDVAEIAKRIRKHIKAAVKDGTLPAGLKTSVRISRYSMGQSLNITVTAYPENFLNPEFIAWKAEHPHDPHFHAPERYTEKYREHLAVLKGFHSSYNHDGSEVMVDYFDVNYYGDVEADYKLEKVFREELEAEHAATVAALEAESSAIVEEALAEGRDLNEADFDRLVAVVTSAPDNEVVKTCPKCGVEATPPEVDETFGFRKLRGNVVPQSWCRPCRRESARARRAAAAGASA